MIDEHGRLMTIIVVEENEMEMHAATRMTTTMAMLDEDHDVIAVDHHYHHHRREMSIDINASFRLVLNIFCLLITVYVMSGKRISTTK
jgi:hypothetical protein